MLANMSCFEECVRLYREAQEEFPWQPAISVHVNLMEGSCLSDPKDLPDLVDEKGHFQISWEKLFFVSYLPSRNRFKKQLDVYKRQRSYNRDGWRKFLSDDRKGS